MSHIENLRVGQWIIVTKDLSTTELTNKLENFPWLLLQVPKIRYLGIPCKVIAISYPFILIQTNGTRSVIDSRTTEWTVANKRYVKKFLEIEDVPDQLVREDESNNSFNGTGKCPRCNESMRFTQVVDGGPACLVCDKCGGEFV